MRKNTVIMFTVLIGLTFFAMGMRSFEEVEKMEKNYEAKDFSKLLGMPGFSEILLKNHFKLYQGYVANTNKVREKMEKLLAEGMEKTPEYAELKRRFGWEFNGMRLHELYFGNLGGKAPLGPETPLYRKLVQVFGSYESWIKDFKATGAMRGIGWVILYQDPDSGLLFNAWINEHDTGHPSGAVPLLVMDVFEHAFITDYQLDRAGYVEAFFNALNWQEIIKRMK